MKGSIISERIKVTSTKLWWILILVGVALTILLGVLPTILVSGTSGTLGLDDPATMRALWGTLGTASVIALIIGIVAMTGEFRHKTITDSFLLEPRRVRFLSAKVIVQALVGAALAVSCVVIGVIAALILLPLKPHAPVDWAFIGQVSIGVVIAFALYAVLGVAVGSLLTNQALAIVAALLWVMLAEPLLGVFLPWLVKWLPGGAAQAVLSGTLPGDPATSSDALLPLWGGVLVLIGYAVVFVTVAIGTTLRRDIT